MTISPAVIAAHGLKQDEYESILSLIGREPSFAELGVFSAMWNEHCSYKSTKIWLKSLPTSGKRVIQGPGENAGVVDIGDGQAVVFKMESHNHPSYIEPYQGAATGVGGILRDIFTMGARPIAAMNALRFGAPDHPKTKHIVSGVVAGIGGYGNSFGVPTVGGEVNFHARYNENCLVNAFAAGVADSDKIFYSEAKGIGLPVVYLGAKTGRDGVGGASMASAEFDDSIDEKRPTVQVGDPFTEKCLLEACMELMQTGAVIAIQDMGAAGLTCSSVEMGAKGNLGIELDLDKLPVRESGMSAYEMLLSESQERMLMILDPEKREVAESVFTKWGLDFAIIGRTIKELKFIVKHQGMVPVDLPIKELGDEAPEYDRPWTAPQKPKELDPNEIPIQFDPIESLKTILGTSEGCSRRWVHEQYDSLVQGNTVEIPGGDAGIVRVGAESAKALAFSVDVTPRYCESDPFEGGKQAVAECWRNLCAVGSEPLAATDNLNFGNPEKPKIMGTIVESIRGIKKACLALDFPIVSGNVSLYNETNGRAILPTPAIGGVGLLTDFQKRAASGFKSEGREILLIGGHGTHLGQSAFLRDCLKKEIGSPPPVDLAKERENGLFIREIIESGLVESCHDISDGGLLVAIAEMSINGGIGCHIEVPDPFIESLFGEDQGRYVLAVASTNIIDIVGLSAEHVELEKIGATGGANLTISRANHDGKMSISVSELADIHESWFPKFMDTY